jgi:hypothetical protein
LDDEGEVLASRLAGFWAMNAGNPGDSGKVGIFGGAAPGGPKEKRTFNTFLRDDAEVDYYDGEG